MSNKVIICDPEPRSEQHIFSALIQDGADASIAENGREAQIMVSKEPYDFLIIDLESKVYSALQVIKYIKSNNIHVHIILVVNSKERISEFFYSEKDIEKLGVAGILIKPFPFAELNKLIRSLNKEHTWKDIELNQQPDYDEVEVKDFDDAFTAIKVSDFFSGNMSIMELYVKAGKNNYIKFLNPGDKISNKKIMEICEKYQAENFYFKTKARRQYINFLNETIEKINKSNKVPLDKKVNLIKNASEKFIDEMYTKGFSNNLLDEGLQICDNTYECIHNNSELSKLFKEYTDYDDSITSHLFLVSLFSSIISQEISWITKKSMPLIILGSFLHDIGKIKLPIHIRNKKAEELDEENYKLYMEHPILGARLLDGVPQITEQIIQIVYQHHEKTNTTGFPLGLSSAKIFPLAKIIGFSDMFAHKVVKEKKTPLQTMQTLLEEKRDL